MRLTVLAAGVLLTASAAAAQQTDSVVQLKLVRCGTISSIPCLSARIPLSSSQADRLRQLDSAAEARAWSGDLAGRMLVGPTVAMPRTVIPPLKLLVLVDRSGSMQGEGIAYTRITLRRFVESLDSGSVRVAIAGFASRGVLSGIAAAAFRSPVQAAADLASLPGPDPQGNTALYSAIVAASRAVADAVRGDPGSQGAVLVVTDGRNDVGHAHDDSGLLAGPSGLAAARGAVADAHQRLWILGVGNEIARDTLRMLVPSDGGVVVASLDPNAMAKRLDEIARALYVGRELIFAMPRGSEPTLARTAWQGTAVATVGGKPAVVRQLAWRPPFFAMPAYVGSVPASEVPASWRDALATGATAHLQWLVLGFFILIGIVAWMLIPRLFWLDASEHTASSAAPGVSAVQAATAAPAIEAAPSVQDGLLRDVTEVAPRRSSDVTNQGARRV